MSKFEEVFNELRMEQEDLDERMSKVRKDAIKHIQDIVNHFGIKSTDIKFYDTEATEPVRQRKPSRIKYRLPNGVEWTGKGIMKKDVEAYLLDNGLTKEDLEQFRVD